MKKTKPRPTNTLRRSGNPVSALNQAKNNQEKVPGRGTKQMTAIEKARIARS
jgi:hypothetical protein